MSVNAIFTLAEGWLDIFETTSSICCGSLWLAIFFTMFMGSNVHFFSMGKP